MAIETRTYKDRREYLKKAVIRRRKKLKKMAVEYKGGKCQCCGYARDITALEFHHSDESKKHFGISSAGITRSWEKTRKELDRCVLLCANCHREVHSGVLQLPDENQGSTPGELRET